MDNKKIWYPNERGTPRLYRRLEFDQNCAGSSLPLKRVITGYELWRDIFLRASELHAKLNSKLDVCIFYPRSRKSDGFRVFVFFSDGLIEQVNLCGLSRWFFSIGNVSESVFACLRCSKICFPTIYRNIMWYHLKTYDLHPFGGCQNPGIWWRVICYITLHDAIVTVLRQDPSHPKKTVRKPWKQTKSPKHRSFHHQFSVATLVSGRVITFCIHVLRLLRKVWLMQLIGPSVLAWGLATAISLWWGKGWFFHVFPGLIKNIPLYFDTT